MNTHSTPAVSADDRVHVMRAGAEQFAYELAAQIAHKHRVEFERLAALFDRCATDGQVVPFAQMIRPRQRGRLLEELAADLRTSCREFGLRVPEPLESMHPVDSLTRPRGRPRRAPAEGGGQ